MAPSGEETDTHQVWQLERQRTRQVVVRGMRAGCKGRDGHLHVCIARRLPSSWLGSKHGVQLALLELVVFLPDLRALNDAAVEAESRVRSGIC